LSDKLGTTKLSWEWPFEQYTTNQQGELTTDVDTNVDYKDTILGDMIAAAKGTNVNDAGQRDYYVVAAKTSRLTGIGEDKGKYYLVEYDDNASYAFCDLVYATAPANTTPQVFTVASLTTKFDIAITATQVD
jgi:hypothetical protein